MDEVKLRIKPSP